MSGTLGLGAENAFACDEQDIPCLIIVFKKRDQERIAIHCHFENEDDLDKAFQEGSLAINKVRCKSE